ADRLLVLIQQHEVRRPFANARRVSGERNLTQDVKNFVTEKRDKKQSDRCEYEPEDLTAIKLRPAKRAKDAENQQRAADCEERKICPWEIARNWILGEEPVGE